MAAPSPLVTKPEYGRPAAAVSLCITILKKAKANTWAEFMDKASVRDLKTVEAVQAFTLTGEQLRLLEEHQHYLSLIQIAPAVVPTFCDTCGTISLQSKGMTKKCINTRGCAGSLYKPGAATKPKSSASKPDDDLD